MTDDRLIDRVKRLALDPENLTGKYKLNPDHSVEPCPDLFEWAIRFEEVDRQVADTTIEDVRISTVFIGLDHSFGRHEGPPLVFETMVFGGKYDGYQDRYCTWDKAVLGHQEMCNKVEWAP